MAASRCLGCRAAQAELLQRAIEGDLHFHGLYFNTACDDGYAVLAAAVDFEGPSFLRDFAAWRERAKYLADLEGQGIGAHSRGYVEHSARKVVAALSDVLAEQPFLTGATPTQADCALFGQMEWALNNFRDAAPTNAVRVMANLFEGHANLMAFHARLREEYLQQRGTGLVVSDQHWRLSYDDIM